MKQNKTTLLDPQLFLVKLNQLHEKQKLNPIEKKQHTCSIGEKKTMNLSLNPEDDRQTPMESHDFKN